MANPIANLGLCTCMVRSESIARQHENSAGLLAAQQLESIRRVSATDVADRNLRC